MTSNFLEYFVNDIIRSKFIAFGIGLLIPTLFFMIINVKLWSLDMQTHFTDGTYPFELWDNIFTCCVVISIIFILYGTFTRKPKRN